MFLNTKFRTDKIETMDDFAMEGEILRDALDKIAKINQLLGGNQLTLQGVQDLTSSISKSNEIVIVDVGCGNGDMLRTLADLHNNYLKTILILAIVVRIYLRHHLRN